MRSTAAACLLRLSNCSSGLKRLFCVAQFRLCLRRVALLPSFLLQSARLLPHYFFHIITSHSAEISLWGSRSAGSRKCFLFVWFTLLKMCLDTFMERAIIQTNLPRFASNSRHLPQVFVFLNFIWLTADGNIFWQINADLVHVCSHHGDDFSPVSQGLLGFNIISRWQTDD